MASKDTRHNLPSYPRVYLTIERQKLNISAEEMSRRLDVSKGYYYALENGLRGHKMTVVMFARILECLDVDANYMIKEEVRYQNEREAYISSKRKTNKTRRWNMETKDLAAIIDEYITYIDRKQITKDSYKRILLQYLDYITTLQIPQPKRNDVLKYKEYLLKNLGSATVQKHIVVLRGFYRYCKLNNYSEDITYEIRGMKIQATFKRQALSLEDSKRLLALAKRRAKDVVGMRNYAIVAILLTTGLRSIEIERADVLDLDIVKGDHVLYVMGKGHDAKDAFVKISDEVYEIIQEYLLARNNDHDALFLTHNKRSESKRLSTKVIRSAVKELLISIGYNSKAYSVHSLRHTFATTALMEGASLLETKEALRHSDVSTTQIYAHQVENMKSETYRKVSDALFKKKR